MTKRSISPFRLGRSSSCGLWTETVLLTEPKRFTHVQWKEFINAVVAYAAPELGPGAENGFAEVAVL